MTGWPGPACRSNIAPCSMPPALLLGVPVIGCARSPCWPCCLAAGRPGRRESPTRVPSTEGRARLPAATARPLAALGERRPRAAARRERRAATRVAPPGKGARQAGPPARLVRLIGRRPMFPDGGGSSCSRIPSGCFFAKRRTGRSRGKAARRGHRGSSRREQGTLGGAAPFPGESADKVHRSGFPRRRRSSPIRRTSSSRPTASA